MTGGEGYIFLSEGGLAVSLANGKPDAVEVTVHVRTPELTARPLADGQVHFENGLVAAATPTKRTGEWELHLKLDGYAAAIWTIPFDPKAIKNQ